MNQTFEDKIFELISLKQEGEFWDFKRQWHENKADLLHDIICMANNLTDNDGYIIIGIDEKISPKPKRRPFSSPVIKPVAAPQRRAQYS